MRQSSCRNGSEMNNRVRDSSCSNCLESFLEINLQNCNIHVEGLRHSHAGSLNGGSVSLSSYEPRLVGFVSFLMVPLAFLNPTVVFFSSDFSKLYSSNTYSVFILGCDIGKMMLSNLSSFPSNMFSSVIQLLTCRFL